MERVSVLMSLYWRERPEALRQALDSVFCQTYPADEVILVVDGPIGEELEAVLAELSEITLVRLAKNSGLGCALNEGLKSCHNSLVARMDTDDISRPNRLELQVAFMEDHPEIAAMSCAIDEFIGSPDNIVSCRSLPLSHEELFEFAKSRSPLNHPATIFRKDAIEDVGGYQHMALFEDYYLWVRLLVKGYRIHNLAESLVLFRTSDNMWKRRGGLSYVKNCINFQIAIWRLGFIGFPAMVKHCVIRFTVCVVPNSFRRTLYRKFLRK